jgi:AraC family transcriptional regulator
VRIEITERQPVRVACLRYTGPPGEPIGRFWRARVAPWLAEHGLLDCPRYGITHDDPRTTAPDQCRYDACVESPRGMTLPDAIEVTIAGGRYAVTPFKGTGAEIGAVWKAFFKAALADPANLLDTRRQAFEHYPRGASFDAKTGVFGNRAKRLVNASRFGEQGIRPGRRRQGQQTGILAPASAGNQVKDVVHGQAINE